MSQKKKIETIRRKLTQADADAIIERHAHYLAQDVDGWQQMRADFRYADLVGISLRGAVLIRADFTGAHLTDVDMRYANLSESDFARAYLLRVRFCGAAMEEAVFVRAVFEISDMSQTDLTNADLSHAVFRGTTKYDGCVFDNTNLSFSEFCPNSDLSLADIFESDFHGACLPGVRFAPDAELDGCSFLSARMPGAYLSGVYAAGVNFGKSDLTGADLSRAALPEASLRGANLSGANVSGALFFRTDFEDAVMPDIPMFCPKEGSFTGYIPTVDASDQIRIVTIAVDKDTRRLSGATNLCRCERALVKQISVPVFDEDGRFFRLEHLSDTASVQMDDSRDASGLTCRLTQGKQIRVPEFSSDRWNENGFGIRFLMTPLEAVRNALVMIDVSHEEDYDPDDGYNDPLDLS